MSGAVAPRAGALACAVVLGLSPLASAWAQAAAGGGAKARAASKAKAAAPKPRAAPAAAPASAHEVKKGETLFSVARKNRHLGVTLNQMAVAVFRANPDAFDKGDANQLKVGSILTIPNRDTVAALNPAEAAQTVQSWRAKPPVPVPVTPPVKEAPPPIAPPKPKPEVEPPAKPRLSREEADARYREGIAAERRGDERAALKAFLEAGHGGHGLAQKRLGEIYDKGNSAVVRDYETALKWYQKAREQGVPIPKPFAFPGGR